MRLIIWIVLAGLILCHGRKRPSGRGQLPVFSSDFSEFFIAAVIERSFDTDNLYLTTFLMGHKSLFHMPQMPFLLINNSVSTTHKWREAGRQWKERSNRNDTFTCRMKNSLAVVKESVQETPALWGPSSTTNDGGFNRNFEVLRCMIPRDINIVATLADQKQKLSKAIKNARLSVEIIRTRNHGHIHGTDSQTPTRANLIAFEVPWKDRRTGYGFDLSRRNSRWEPWQGVLSPPRSRQQFSFNGVKEGDVPLNASSSTRGQTSSFRMSPISVVCMSIVRPLEPFRMDTGMTMLVENIEHNILIGFDHIFVGLHLDPLSVHMQRYRLALDPFIRAGRVSLSSMALSGFDDVAGYHGVVLIDDYVRYIHEQQCLYMAKGVADYVALFHASEFLALKPPITNVQELMLWSAAHLHTPLSAVAGTQGQGHKPAHTQGSRSGLPCYFKLESLGVPDPPDKENSFGPGDGHWTHTFFSKSSPIGPLPGWATVVVPTRNVWLAGWHVCGACSKVLVNTTTADPMAVSLTTKRQKHGPSFDRDRVGTQRGAIVRSSPEWPQEVGEVGEAGDERGHVKGSGGSVIAERAAGGEVNDEPWSPASVRHETHAGLIPSEVASMYFCRGWFDTWQLERPRHSRNYHLDTYSTAVLRRLEERGFALVGSMLTLRTSVAAVRKFYPAYFAAVATLEGTPRYLDEATSATGAGSEGSWDPESAMVVNLSSRRTKAWQALLEVPSLGGSESPTVGHLISATPVGKQGVMAEGTWLECVSSNKCASASDLLGVR